MRHSPSCFNTLLGIIWSLKSLSVFIEEVLALPSTKQTTVSSLQATSLVDQRKVFREYP